jgi:hypothetical protein
MEATDSTIITDLSLQCKQRFTILCREISSLDSNNSRARGPFPEGFIPEANLDSFARFRVWAGNIGAFQRNKSSLDHRIRHSAVKDEVARLLTRLLCALADCKSFFNVKWL